MKFTVRPAADADIDSQSDWYKNQGLTAIAKRLLDAIDKSFKSIAKLPNAGSPRHYNNPRLTGIRTWPIEGFKEMRVYYHVRKNEIVILRILHDKRDVDTIMNDKAGDNE